MTLTTQQRGLIVSGAILFLLGLIQGALIQNFTNPRMALSAHLTAVQCGMALMIVGVIWSAMLYSEAREKAARLLIPIGAYGLWLGLTLSAALGTSTNLPIAGAGHKADDTAELFVSALVLGGSALMGVGWMMFVAGLVKPKRSAESD